jgi:hypothetical protein
VQELRATIPLVGQAKGATAKPHRKRRAEHQLVSRGWPLLHANRRRQTSYTPPNMKRKGRKPANVSIKALKRRFDVAHQKGLRALKRGDYDQFGKIIADERAIIDELVRQKPTARKRKATKKR